MARRPKRPTHGWTATSLLQWSGAGEIRGLAVSRGMLGVATAGELHELDPFTGDRLDPRRLPDLASGLACDASGDWLVGSVCGVMRGKRTLGDRVSVWIESASGRMVVGALAHRGPDPEAFVELWDLAAEQRLLDLPVEAGTVFVAISPDGTRIAAGTEAGAARLWSADGRLLGERRYASPVWGVAFSPDGDALAIGPESGPVEILDPADGRLRAEVPDTRGAWKVAFGPGGVLAVGGGFGLTLHQHGTAVALDDDRFSDVTHLWWLPDGSLLTAGTLDFVHREVRRWVHA